MNAVRWENSRGICGVSKRIDFSNFRESKSNTGHYASINSLSLSSDSDQKWWSSSSDDHSVCLWSSYSASGSAAIAKFASHSCAVYASEFLGEENLISAGHDGRLFCHNLNTLQSTHVSTVDSAINSLTVVSATTLVAGTQNGYILLNDLRQQGGMVFHYSPFEITSVACRPTFQYQIATGTTGMGVAVLDIRYSHQNTKESSSVFMVPRKHTHVTGVSWHSSGDRILATEVGLCPSVYYYNGTVTTLENATFKNRATFKRAIWTGANEDIIVCGADDSSIYTWRQNEPNGILPVSRSISNCFIYHRCQDHLRSAGVNKKIRLWVPSLKKPPTPNHSSNTETLHNSQFRQDCKVLQLRDIESRNIEENSAFLDYFDHLVSTYSSF